MDLFVAAYLVMLAGIAGYVLIANVPSLLHTPLMSGSNFIHGVVLAGGMVSLGHATNDLERTLAFLAVVAATANSVGGYLVTDRMLAILEKSAKSKKKAADEKQKTKTNAQSLASVKEKESTKADSETDHHA